MMLTEQTKQKIENILNGDRIILFMKGTPDMPQCGFSAQATSILKNLNVEFTSVNVLASPEIRDGIKIFGNWPTIPQLYVNKELIGGCDIMTEMYESGELAQLLKS